MQTINERFNAHDPLKTGLSGNRARWIENSQTKEGYIHQVKSDGTMMVQPDGKPYCVMVDGKVTPIDIIKGY